MSATNHGHELSSRSALLIIDMQKGCLASDFGIPQQDTIFDVVTNIKGVLDICRQKGIPIIHTREIHRASLIDFGRETDGSEGIHLLENSPDSLYIEGLEPLGDEYEIIKRRYSAFFCTDLDILLRALRVDTLILTGELTNVCVHYTFVDAHQRDYYVRVLSDCVSGSDPDAHIAALNQMKYLQRNAVISSTDFFSLISASGGHTHASE